jgi:hypothetical protein
VTLREKDLLYEAFESNPFETVRKSAIHAYIGQMTYEIPQYEFEQRIEALEAIVAELPDDEAVRAECTDRIASIQDTQEENRRLEERRPEVVTSESRRMGAVDVGVVGGESVSGQRAYSPTRGITSRRTTSITPAGPPTLGLPGHLPAQKHWQVVGRFGEIVDSMPTEYEFYIWLGWQFEPEYYLDEDAPKEESFVLYVMSFNPDWAGGMDGGVLPPQLSVGDRACLSIRREDQPVPGYYHGSPVASGAMVLAPTPPPHDLDVTGAQEPKMAAEFAHLLPRLEPIKAAQLIGQIRAEHACPALRSALAELVDRSDDAIRMITLGVLARLGSTEALESLVDESAASLSGFAAEDAIVDRMSPASYEKNLAWSTIAAVKESPPENVRSAADKLLALVRNEMVVLSFRMELLAALSRHRLPGARPVFREYLHHSDPKIASSAARGLYRNTPALSDFTLAEHELAPWNAEAFAANRDAIIARWEAWERAAEASGLSTVR